MVGGVGKKGGDQRTRAGTNSTRGKGVDAELDVLGSKKVH